MRAVQFDRAMIEKYNVNGPRYTSYPSALQFHEGFDEASYRHAAAVSNAGESPPELSLYVHLPFCARLCHYCACNRIVTNKRSVAVPYLARVVRELSMHAELFDDAREVTQLHWGGGTPTFIADEQAAELMEAIRSRFRLSADAQAERAIEIDPRELRADTLGVLRRIGFNRMSIGVQDFEPRVQRAINRLQSRELTEEVIAEARRLGFDSISVDLIYGLPLQTLSTMQRTLEQLIALAPDRISLYNYAHLPERFPAQARLRREDMPTPATKLDILQEAIRRLTAAGYAYIGMDHFARKSDALYRAQCNGTLHRNFQGYSTHADCDLIGVGTSAIGTVSGSFYQNHKGLAEYYASIDAGRLPVAKGLDPAREDRLRRAIIMTLICHFEIDYASFNRRWNIDFRSRYRYELQRLDDMGRDGLLEKDAAGLRVTPRGRLLVRNICMVFDRYVKPALAPRPYSQTI